jgi:hypothetical protein
MPGNAQPLQARLLPIVFLGKWFVSGSFPFASFSREGDKLQKVTVQVGATASRKHRSRETAAEDMENGLLRLR